ncbi:MAG: Sua5/YciO/YrdC/YwlC family protein [Parcubacteria group bacterium]|jgi:L-threonylcarbamoyladenylate synthase
MPKYLTQKDIFANQDFYASEIQKGRLFIYPTDTLHGLGADAKNTGSIEKIVALKKRTGQAFLVIAPSLEWIFFNCEISNATIKKLLTEKLPGPFSFILRLKNTQAVAPLALNFGETIGVRLPKNWFWEIIAKSGAPFISTSINYSATLSAKSLEDIPTEILNSVDYIIWDDAAPTGKASTIIDVTSGVPKILRK